MWCVWTFGDSSLEYEWWLRLESDHLFLSGTCNSVICLWTSLYIIFQIYEMETSTGNSRGCWDKWDGTHRALSTREVNTWFFPFANVKLKMKANMFHFTCKRLSLLSLSNEQSSHCPTWHLHFVKSGLTCLIVWPMMARTLMEFYFYDENIDKVMGQGWLKMREFSLQWVWASMWKPNLGYKCKFTITEVNAC